MREARGAGAVVVALFVWSAASLLWGCAPRSEEPSSTSLPTRQTTIDTVVKKLDAAQQEAEKRRAEIDGIGK